MAFRLKLLLTFIIYGLSLVIFTQVIKFKLDERHIKTASIEKASEIFEKKSKFFKYYIKDTNLKLLSIKNSKTFAAFQTTPSDMENINSLFLDIASTSDNIMQLRYIDKDGKELIRIDRNTYSSNTYLVPKEKLQDKSTRYYFQEAFKSKPETFWYSHLDLNIEHGIIEKPIKPVLRVAIPTLYKGEKTGILIINIFMKNFLKELTDDVFNNIYLFDHDGKIMVDSVHKHCWSKYLNTDENIYTHFNKENLKDIFLQDRYSSENIYAGNIFLNTRESIHMIIEPKYEYIEDELSEIISDLSLILLGVILISLPLSYFFSNIPTKLKEKVDKQKEEQDVLLSLFDLGDAVLFKWNNDENWSVNSVSKSVEKLLGYKDSDFIDDNVTYASCIHHDDLEQVLEGVTQAVDSKVYFFGHKPYRVITKDKKLKWILDRTVVVRDAEDTIINFIGYLTDITELKNSELLLKNISRTDQLTKISNRMHIDDILQAQFYRFNRSSEVCSVILLDIDYFKAVNDQYGHLIGDKVLIEFAKLLNTSIRVGDTVGRWGGEEFLIILPYTDLEQATLIAEKLRLLVSSYTFTKVNQKTASFGVATFEEGMSIESLTNEADKALYKSKKDGRNCVSVMQVESLR